MTERLHLQPMTRRQAEILDFLTREISEKNCAPSLEEVGRHFGLTSLATVHKHLLNLAEKGYITRLWNRSRAITIVHFDVCPYCKRPYEQQAAS